MMELGENASADETGLVIGEDTGRVIAKFSHASEAESFVELVNQLNEEKECDTCKHNGFQWISRTACTGCCIEKQYSHYERKI